MAGEGSALASIQIMRRNKALLKKSKYFDIKSDYYKAAKKKRISDPKKASSEQLKQIRLQLIADKRKGKWVKSIVFALAIVLTVGFLWIGIYYMKVVFGY